MKLLSLSTVNSEISQENKIENFLKPIDSLSLDSDSDVSEIIDPFEKFHKNCLLKPLPGTKSKYLTKYEADIKTIELFTGDFKDTIENVKKEQKNIPKDMLECLNNVEETINSTPKNIFTFKPLSDETLKQLTIDEKNSDRSVDSELSCESNFWRLLEAHSSKTFQITPPGYDSRKARHWLERPPIDWNEVNLSRLKCLKWLEQQDKKG